MATLKIDGKKTNPNEVVIHCDEAALKISVCWFSQKAVIEIDGKPVLTVNTVELLSAAKFIYDSGAKPK